MLVAAGARSQSFKKLLDKGDALLLTDPGMALGYFQKAMELDSESVDANFRYAEALRLTSQPGRALYYYGKVYQRTLGKLYPTSIIHLAMLQKMAGEYKDAADSFKKAQRVFKDKKSAENIKAKQEQKFCRWAEFEVRKPLDIEVKPLEADFSCRQQYGASVQQETIWYTGVMEDGVTATVLQGTMNGTSAEKVVPVAGMNTGEQHVANPALSPDGKRMYVTVCDPNPDNPYAPKHCGLAVSWREGDGWSKPERLDVLDVEGSVTTQPDVALVNSAEMLFFASNRPGGEGGMDIWYCTVTNGNSYSKPVNAGKQINSREDEITPHYCGECGTLYFSGTWQQGFGGFDIHYSKGVPGSFEAPQNAGRPFNSPLNDMYLRKSDRYITFTSNRDNGQSTCCNRIYVYEKPKQQDSVPPPETLEDLFKYLPVTLYFHNDRPNPNSLDTFTTLNYLQTWRDYTALIPTYRSEYSKGLSGAEAQEASDQIDSFFVQRVNKGVDDLERFTPLLIRELEKGRDIELTIQGFASPLAATKYNVGLTKRRISSLVNYLREAEGGVIAPYLDKTAANGGSLELVYIPFGEYSADQTVSDNPNDQKNSVYSRNAALERKIEIQKVKLVSRSDTAHAEIRFKKEIHDFGGVKSGQLLSWKFPFTNVGTGNLEITGIEPSSDAIDAETSVYTLTPGQEGEIKVEVDTTDMKGLTVLRIRIITNGVPTEKEIMVTFEAK
jgi:hypothetical protein